MLSASAALRLPAASQPKAPLNVVLIIDTYLPLDTDEVVAKRAAVFLKRSLVRILLYFQCNMDAKFQWTYQFFNSRLHQDIGLTPNRVLQSLSISTVTSCVDEYRKIITAETSCGKGPNSGIGAVKKSGGTSNVSPCYNLRRQLVHSLADFGLDISSYQSPMKSTSSFLRSQSLQKHFPPVNIKNYIYVLSPLPRTWTDITNFLEGKRQSQKELNTMGPRKNDILDVLKGVKDAFFEQGLWDRFLDQRTSLSWIDTSMPDASDESSKIHPGLGVKMSKDSWQALPSAAAGISTEDIRSASIMWSGDLLCSQSLEYICALDVAIPFCSGIVDSTSTSKLNQIASVHVIKRIQSRLLFSSLRTLKVASTMACFPRLDNGGPCGRASYLFKSLCTKNDVLLLEITFQCQDDESNVIHGAESQQYTRLALLHATTSKSGIMQVFEGESDTMDILPADAPIDNRVRSFSVAMMEKAWSRLGAFVDQEDRQEGTGPNYRLEKLPLYILKSLKPSQDAPTTVIETRQSTSKPLPGESVTEMSNVPIDMQRAESIDELCLVVRKTYIRYLYNDETVSDYVKRLNAASKEITVLAAKQSIPLREAQQKLVAFIIEFLRIWPSRMGSKYRQIAKELNAGRETESRSQDNYVILEDERPQLDAWKAQVMRSIKDENVRMHLRRLKTKDTQIQMVHNLHILLLMDKYGLEENKPFKKDPGALKTVNLFMDELCIAASIEDRTIPGLMSPQTPRSRDMDSAKKFFARVVARYYESALPKVVAKLSVKCGMEKGLLTSPRPSRGSKRAGIQRSISMGILQKPRPLDLSAAMEDYSVGSFSSCSSTPTPVEAVAPKNGFPMTRQSTSDNPAKNVLNSSIFRNRQVVMTRGSVQGVGAAAPSITLPMSTSFATKAVAPSKALPTGPVRSKSMNAMDNMEDEDGPPKLAKLKLKKFYHDKESEEVLKFFRRQRPLSQDLSPPDFVRKRSTSYGNEMNEMTVPSAAKRVCLTQVHGECP
ncbi:hypothetical protein EDD11_007924 [Mortierella claussenii]|nr:hypothetical protein EDD11_007924 [Mortierella claussenii]